MPPVAERRSRGATLALPLLLAVGLYGVFYVGLDVRTVPQVKLTTPVPSVQALRAGRLRDAGAFQAHSTAEAAVKLQVRPRGSDVEARAVTLRERPRSSDVEAPAPVPELAPVGRVRERPLLSQRTPAWDRLREEGLFHDNSGYLRIEPQNADELAEKTFWEDRVKAEFHDGACALPTPRRAPGSSRGATGCRRVANNTKQCLPKLIIMGQFKAGTTALFDMLAQHPDVLLPRKTEELKWHEMCPLNKPACVIKEVNGACMACRARVCAAAHLQRHAGFTRLSERQRWDERALFSRYHILPVQDDDDTRPVMEASPYYLSGMPDSFEDLTRFTRYIPGVKMIALVLNPVDRAFSEYIMFSEPPFKQNASGCGRGPLRARFETLAVEELAVASPALNEDGTLAHRCLKDSTKWQQVPRAAGQSGTRMRAPCRTISLDTWFLQIFAGGCFAGANTSITFRCGCVYWGLTSWPWCATKTWTHTLSVCLQSCKSGRACGQLCSRRCTPTWPGVGAASRAGRGTPRRRPRPTADDALALGRGRRRSGCTPRRPRLCRRTLRRTMPSLRSSRARISTTGPAGSAQCTSARARATTGPTGWLRSRKPLRAADGRAAPRSC